MFLWAAREISGVEIEKIQKWLFNFLKFAPKKDLEDKTNEIIENVKRLRGIITQDKVEARRPEMEKLLGDMFLKSLELANDLQVDMPLVLKRDFKLGV